MSQFSTLRPAGSKRPQRHRISQPVHRCGLPITAHGAVEEIGGVVRSQPSPALRREGSSWHRASLVNGPAYSIILAIDLTPPSGMFSLCSHGLAVEQRIPAAAQAGGVGTLDVWKRHTGLELALRPDVFRGRSPHR